MKISSFLICLFILSFGYAQNKKEQIEILNARLDSLNIIKATEKQNYDKRKNSLDSTIILNNKEINELSKKVLIKEENLKNEIKKNDNLSQEISSLKEKLKSIDGSLTAVNQKLDGIANAIKLDLKNKELIASYDGVYYFHRPGGPPYTAMRFIANPQITIHVKDGSFEVYVNSGYWKDTENLRDIQVDTTYLFSLKLILAKKYKVTDFISTEDQYGFEMYSAFGCEYFEFKDNKIYLYDENFKPISEWYCCPVNFSSEEAEICDCSVSKTN
jgi:hypothetical protein